MRFKFFKFILMLMNQFKDKKVLIMGLGLNPKGSGVSAAKFFIDCGAKVIVTDLKTEKELKPSLKILKRLFAHPSKVPSAERKGIEFVLGRHRESDFTDADLIIKNPSARWDSPYIQLAKKNGIPIETDIGLFWKLCPAPIIGVSGTRGKSTTTALIYKMLKKKFKSAFMGGNIQLSPLNFVEKVKPDSKIVLELSSWMLEDTFYIPYELKKNYEIAKNIMTGPHIAVLTNIMPDHLNTYKNFNDYVNAKALIFKNQNSEDFAVLNYDDKRARNLFKEIKSQKIWFSEKKIVDGVYVKNRVIIWNFGGKKEKIASLEDTILFGKHNIKNILAAVAVAKLEGVSNRIIQNVLKTFKGLPNRLEFIREVNGVKFYNDTTSTMPEAAIAALEALAEKYFKKIILIAGGSDKGLDYKNLAKEIKKHCKAAVLFKGEASDKLLKEFLPTLRSGSSTLCVGTIIKNVISMKEAVGNALKLAKKDDIILLSPGAASFGLFQNEFDRGEQFVKMVKKL